MPAARRVAPSTPRPKAPPAKAAPRSAAISLRVPAPALDLIDEAAASLGTTRTEFMLASARQSATDVLLDRRALRLNEAAFNAFLAALDAPLPPNAALKRLLARRPPWES